MSRWYLVAAVIVAGCRNEPEAPALPVPPCIRGECVVDPTSHCIVREGCRNSGECPAGTICASATSSPCDQSPCSCRIPPADYSPKNALLAGFQVRSFQLRDASDPTSRGKAAFTWDVPDGARMMRCALFGCPPVIAPYAVNGVIRAAIGNYAQCALAEKVFEPAGGVFDLADSSLETASTPPAPGLCKEAASEWLITQLLVGCWAYDAAKVIAASPLVTLEPWQTHNFRQAMDATCASGLRRSCYHAASREWGTCLRKDHCARRCLSAADCAHGAELRDGGLDATPRDGGTSAYRCERPTPASIVGVCVGATWSSELGSER